VKQFTLRHEVPKRAAVTFRAAGSVRISANATMLLTDRVDQLDVHPDAMRIRTRARRRIEPIAEPDQNSPVSPRGVAPVILRRLGRRG